MSETVGLVQQFVELAGQLYSLPAVAAEVLRLTSEHGVHADRLRECIERDPALATRMLRVVNSSLFGLSRQVTDLGQALTLLGIRPLKMLVLGFSLPKELFTDLEAQVLTHYWRRTLVKAIAARELAEGLWRMPGDEAFIAGLVQDIGILVLVQQLGQPYQEFLRQLREHGGDLLAHEIETLGFDHLVLSSRLLRHWQLPESLCFAVAVPPNEARISALGAGQRELPQILHLAELLAQLVEQPYGPALKYLLEIGGRYCGLTYEKLQPLMATLQGQVHELAEVLALELPEGAGYADILIAAQQRLSEESFASVIAPPAPVQEELLLALTAQIQQELTGSHRRGAAKPPASSRPVAVPRVQTSSPEGPARPPRRSATIPRDSALAARVGGAIQRCRQSRRPISLAVFELDRFGELLLQLGPGGIGELTHWLAAGLADWTGAMDKACAVSESCFAVVLEECSRSDALRQVRSAVREAKPRSCDLFPPHYAITLSAGLASLEFPPKNYPPHELIDAALRCLSTAQLSGGDTVKSIAI